MHPDVLSELVRPSIDYIRHKRFRSGNFPSSLSNESDRLVHWCHGAPGVIHMLLMAHQVCAPPLFYIICDPCCWFCLSVLNYLIISSWNWTKGTEMRWFLMTWMEAFRCLQRSAAHPHPRSLPGPAACWRLFLPVSYTFCWPGGFALLLSGISGDKQESAS